MKCKRCKSEYQGDDDTWCWDEEVAPGVKVGDWDWDWNEGLCYICYLITLGDRYDAMFASGEIVEEDIPF